MRDSQMEAARKCCARQLLSLTAVKRQKFAKVKQSTSKLRLLFFTVLNLIFYQVNLPNVLKVYEKKFLAFENYELQNCRRHLPTQFCSGPKSFGQFSTKKKDLQHEKLHRACNIAFIPKRLVQEVPSH